MTSLPREWRQWQIEWKFTLYFLSSEEFIPSIKCASFKGSMTHLQNFVGGLEKKWGNYKVTNVKWQFMVANYEIVEFIAVIQRLIDNFTIFF